MKTVNFKESNKIYTKPDSMTDKECTPLHTFVDGKEVISKWRGSFRDRMNFLFYGHIWLHVAGTGQPPVLLQAKKTVFIQNKAKKSTDISKIIGHTIATLVLLGISYVFLSFVQSNWNIRNWTINSKIVFVGFFLFTLYSIYIKNREKDA